MEFPDLRTPALHWLLYWIPLWVTPISPESAQLNPKSKTVSSCPSSSPASLSSPTSSSPMALNLIWLLYRTLTPIVCDHACRSDRCSLSQSHSHYYSTPPGLPDHLRPTTAISVLCPSNSRSWGFRAPRPPEECLKHRSRHAAAKRVRPEIKRGISRARAIVPV